MDDIDVGILVPVGLMVLMLFGIWMTDNPYYEILFACIGMIDAWAVGKNG